MASPVSPSPAGATATCASCGKPATGKFCSNCGAPLAGATCAACGAALTPGAKFCHRCGTPASAHASAPSGGERGFSAALPWGLAAIAFVALVALLAGQRFGRSPDNAAAGAPAGAPGSAPFAGATGNGQAPDISNMSPSEAAIRLYNRVMGAHERGRADSVQIFAPMAITAYQMLGNLDLDQRYDLGRIAAVSGDEPLARAEADTILSQNPTHLLGLILASNAAHMRKDTAAERAYRDKLAANAPAERAKQLPEYVTHENDITIALDAKRP
ncbi:MAG TPA: zinc ribbon domain-containing protein [Gemmatimonadaceae bacterium]